MFDAFDWRASALGDPAGWPAALRLHARLMLDTPVPMAITWGPQRIMLYNAAYAEIHADKHPWGLGRPLHEVWAADWDRAAPLAARVDAGESYRVDDMPVERERQGVRETVWFNVFFAPLRDDEGVQRGTCCTLVDTTSRVRAEAEVRELNRTLEARVAERTAELERSEAHWLSLFGQTAAGIVETDLEMRILRANAKFGAILGRGAEGLRGTLVVELLHPDDLEQNTRLLGAMLRTGRPVEVENRYLRQDGTPVWVAKTVTPIVEPGAPAPTSVLAVVVDITQRKLAEARARDSVERLQLASRAADLGIWSWDIAPDRAHWENERMYTLTGVTRAQGPVSNERFIEEFLHPDDAAAYRRCVEHTLATGAPLRFQGRLLRASDRALRWFEFTGLLHRDLDGRPLSMVGTAADITDTKSTVERLRDAQGRLEATLQAGEIGTWMFDLREYKLYADANMAQLHGIDEEAVRSASPLAYMHAIHPDDLASVTASLGRARATGEPYDAIYRVRLADGAERVIHARGRVEFEDGLPARLPGVVIDITRQRRIEEQFREREERYRTLLTSIDEGFCIAELVFDAAGHVVDHCFLETNEAFERHTGLRDAVGRCASELAPGIEPLWNDLYERVAASGEPLRSIEYAQPLGRWFDVFISRAFAGATTQVALVFRDITAQKRADEELRQLAADLAGANRRQSEFLATLAHELRNPLAPIRTALDLMRIRPGSLAGDSQALAKVRAMMERQVDHLIHLVNDLLDLARIQRGKIELQCAPVALQDVVVDAVETAMPAIQARGHALGVQAADEALLLVADRNRLVQVIGNLLTNAAKYTPTGGRIELAARRDGDMAEVTVRDNGIGIPADALPTLFEMFNQGRNGAAYAQGGLGIGLSLVKSLVEQHGGSVAAASPGAQQGSTFTLRLPLAGPGDATAATAPVARAAGGAALRVLIADDNRDAAEMLAEALRLHGHSVSTAHDGLAALALARASHPDLALLDIGMPGMDGHALARALRVDPALRKTVLVAVTGWGTEEDRARSRAAGFDHHLTKPVDLDSVQAILSSVAPAGP